ncbi:hypothetical protein [Rhizobium leguminosarum]|uniref:hypothetical protein n=1 Tax=Rhizobium leguminosarum TaxID=384 RepID=UPI001FD91361|nr:hypothetical protein [Rhizobium leguminosarum]MDX6000417.1 hypothetical protein [Rhizobium leguminosarum]
MTLSHRYATVKVLDPLIAPDVRGTGELTPHVYRHRQPPHSPALCAWDPVDEPFNPTVYLADHVIPAVIRWLVFYEDWLDTGVWRGGGKHPDPDAGMLSRSSFSSGGASLEPRRLDAVLERRVTKEAGSATSAMSISRASWGLFPSTLELVRYRYHRIFVNRSPAPLI